jgi:hypothetical protein
MSTRVKRLLAAMAGLSLVLVPAAVYASLAPSFTQTINAGSLTSDIYQSDDTTPVASPAAAFSSENYSFQCQTSTATLGDSNNKLNVTNLATGKSSWNIAIAATSGDSATWTSGGNTYKYNDSTGAPAGCTNGQLTVDPSVSTITDDCNSSCTANDGTVSKGASTTYVSGSVSSATLMSDSAGTPWEGYMTGISLSQKIPALTPSGSYTLPMTITLSST